MFNYVRESVVPQTEALPGQVPNSAGGYAYAVSDWVRLDRFLVLGSESNTYYATARKLTMESTQAIQRCIDSDAVRVVQRVVEISDAGRAPKNDPALYVLALALKMAGLDGRRAAAEALPRVARTGTHLFHLAEFVNAIGGWGRVTKRAFAKWYTDMEPARLAYQIAKYQQRDGWSHQDILRLAHPWCETPAGQAVLRYAAKGELCADAPASLVAAAHAKICDRKTLKQLISEACLTHECVPNEAKSDPEVWEAMLPWMGMTALIRNLGKMTSVGLLAPLAGATALVAERLYDPAAIKHGRVHPLAILTALQTYQQGHGDKGKLTWTPVQKIVDALDEAFYLAFQTVEPTNKRVLLALDISASMNSGQIAGMGITPRVGAAAMALMTASVEPEHAFVGFTAGPRRSKWGTGTGLTPLAISPRQRIADVCTYMDQLPMGGTDCSLPMIWARENKVPVDVFQIYTDSETWADNEHPVLALSAYQQAMGRPAKMVVIGMVSNGFSIADPNRVDMLDVVGFDTAAPGLIADFART